MTDTTLLRLTLVAALFAGGVSLLALLEDDAAGDARGAALDGRAGSLRAEIDRLAELVDALRAERTRPGTPPAGTPGAPAAGAPAPITVAEGLPLALQQRLDALEQQLAELRARVDESLDLLRSGPLVPPELDGEAEPKLGPLYELAGELDRDEEAAGRKHFLWRPQDWLATYGTPSEWDHAGNTWWWQYELPDAGNPTRVKLVTVVFSGGFTSHVGIER